MTLRCTLTVALVLLVEAGTSRPAIACTDPTGAAGDILYNAQHSVMQWCDGDQWIGFPKTSGLALWKQHKTGSSHNCGVQLDGTAWCYGTGLHGKLGDGTYDDTPGNAQSGTLTPVQVGSGNTLWDDWVEVAPGGFSTCGLREDGTAWCWGYRYQGLIGNGSSSSGNYTTPVQVGSGNTLWDDWISISASFVSNCGLRSDGTAWCWGAGQYGTIGDGSTGYRTAPKQVGTTGTGTLWDDWVSIDSNGGSTHVCGIRADGSAWCWGENERGQLGNGMTSAMSKIPVRVGTSDSGTLWSDWTSISVGKYSTCGLRENGTAWCWGSGRWGTSPHDPSLDKTVPTRLGTSETGTLWDDWVRIDYSHVNGCGLRSDGSAWCWGYLHGFQDTPVPLPNPAPKTTINWTGFSTGSAGSCGIRSDSSLWCWDGFAQFISSPKPVKDGDIETGTCVSPTGDPGDMAFNADHSVMQWCDGTQWIGLPKPPPEEEGWASIHASTFHTCGIVSSGQAYCWGYNNSGQLGTGAAENSLAPKRVVGGQRWKNITTGSFHTCGVTTNGEGYCWGSGGNGSLGDGSMIGSQDPTKIIGDYVWKSISAGENFTCGVTTAGVGYCWGNGFRGQMGDGGNTTSNWDPVAISGSFEWLEISAGDRYACGVTTSGAGYCWGDGSSGQLGNGDTDDRNVPTLVSGSHNWSHISTGSEHACGVTTNGEGYCWGKNGSSGVPGAGRLGTGNTTDSNLPTLVVGGHTWSQISPGAFSTCGLTTSGDGYCWGTWDALGHNSTSNSSSPIAVYGSYDWSQIRSGSNYACGVTLEGDGYCWGRDTSAFGKLGTGDTADRRRPWPLAEVSGPEGCTWPGGKVGDMLFNADHQRLQWCDGVEWIGIPTP